MFDFPANPNLNQVYTQGGVSYKWNGYAWVMTAGGAGVTDGDKGDVIVSNSGATWTLDYTAVDTRYVNTGGDTMTGNLTIATGSAVNSILEINKQAGGVTNGTARIVGSSYGAKRWTLDLGNTDQEFYPSPPRVDKDGVEAQTGTPNAGSNFLIQNYDDAGLATNALKIYRLDRYAEFYGNLDVWKYQPRLGVDKPQASDDAALTGSMNGVYRWWVDVGDGTAETGSNAGSNFTIDRFSDAGVWIDSPIKITRSTGQVTFNADPTIYKTAPNFILNSDVQNGFATIQFKRAGLNRWQLIDSGSLGNYDFKLQRYNTSGAYVDTPFYVNGTSGVVDFAQTPTVLGSPLGGGGSGFLPLAGGTMTGAITTKATSGGIATASGNSGLEVKGAGAAGDGAYMSFHRPGQYAIHFGLDSDNALVIGGWSMGATRSAIYHTGNFNPASYAPVGGVGGQFNCAPLYAQAGTYAVTGVSAGTAGVIGYGPGNGYYAFLGYGSWTVYGAGGSGMYSTTEVRGEGYVRSMASSLIAVGHATTASAANCQISTGGVIQRFTSSEAFKSAIEPMQADYADRVLDLTPIFFRPGPGTVDRKDWSRFGFSAEQCHSIDPRYATSSRKILRDENGRQILERAMRPIPNPEYMAWHAAPAETRGPEPEPDIMSNELTGEVIYEGDENTLEQINIDLNAIVAGLLDVVKRMDARIKVLEGKPA